MAFIFLLTSLLLFLKRPKLKVDSSTGTMFAISLWMLFNSIVITIMGVGAVKGYGFDLAPKVIAVAAYMAISALSFKQFREKLLSALNILCIATLIAWFLHINLGIGSFGKSPAPTFGIFMDWGGRMASIYWEPGEYQIIMIFVLVLFFDEFRNMRLINIMRYVRRFGIIILALIVCQSTMGYLSLMALLGIAFMFNASVKKHKIMYFMLMVIACVITMLIWNSDVVQNKIASDNLRERSSLYIRLMDNYALLNMSMINPIIGIGQGNKDYAKYSKMFSDTTSTNGWFKLAVMYGWPFLAFIIMCILKNLKRMNLGIPVLLMFIPLFLSQSNEHNALFPITYIYIYKYRYYFDENPFATQKRKASHIGVE